MNRRKSVVGVKVNPKHKGILFILLSAFCFAWMNVCVRMSGDVPTLQKSFFRNLIAAGVAAVMHRGQKLYLGSKKQTLSLHS